MLQVVQYQKTGEMRVEDFPAPACPAGGILVRTSFSLISAGTEKTSVGNAQVSMIQRAKRQPEQVKTVIDTLKKDGIISTYNKVKSALDSYKVLGYSASGIVIESRCDEFNVGDAVICAGAGKANHAELLAIPKNLAVRIPEGVSLEEAAYTTVGSIAMQGVRQADIRLGETVAVIGLGLLGQITVQLLKASGCRVIGLDIDESLFDTALKYGCDKVFKSDEDAIKSIQAYSRGLGCDSVVITASTGSNQPMELALKLARKKGKVVIVGGIGMNLPRPDFYLKELEIKISCSYGPGRYDPTYEEKGVDYPAAYVRWTENRNMQAFLDLIAEKKMDVKSMTTHTYKVKDAATAYELITGKIPEKFLGILLEYPERKDALNRTISISNTAPNGKLGIAFVGAGSFAQSYLMPPLKDTGVDMIGVSTNTPANAETAGRQFGFNKCSTDSSELIKDKDVNAVFCATRHDTHAQYVTESLNAGKSVFVEKPLAISREEVEAIDKAAAKGTAGVMVGFNRRFSKSFELINKFFEGRHDPMVINYRVNAGLVPKSHWAQAPENGGRIIGEACHFIDCMVYLTKALPVKVYADAISSSNVEGVNRDNVVITIKFSDGSVGSLQYLANGDKSVPKEYMEAYCEGSTAFMNNFESVELIRNGKTKKHNLDGKKGHKEEVVATVEAMKAGKEMPISYEAIRAITMATIAAEESLDSGAAVEL
ncbi:MAG: bi-domain-containing oxidoreductase [Chlorobi bacterium]|nr:bi-domain-containing oxidoreductase [Chlorobiota bacterium]